MLDHLEVDILVPRIEETLSSVHINQTVEHFKLVQELQHTSRKIDHQESDHCKNKQGGAETKRKPEREQYCYS